MQEMRKEVPKRRTGNLWIFVHAMFALAALAVMMFAIPSATAAFKYLKTGMEVPDFTIKSLDDKEIAIADFKGSSASLILFWATWSPRSRPALEDAEKLLAEYGDKGFKVLAINVNGLNISHQDRKEIKAMQKELGDADEPKLTRLKRGVAWRQARVERLATEREATPRMLERSCWPRGIRIRVPSSTGSPNESA